MSILNIIWKTGPPYRLWAKGNVQLTAQVIRPLRNHVYYARIGTTGTKATQAIALKIAHGVQEFMGMEREVEFYEHELKNLQGTVVPRMHGFFRGTTIDLIVAGCMLLEFCEGPMPVNLIVRNQEIMLCALRLHAAGVTHCDLINGHHFVLQGAEIRIVDFSLAIRHVCTPLPMQRGIRQATDCTELQNMKELYGRFSNEVTHGIDRSIQH